MATIRRHPIAAYFALVYRITWGAILVFLGSMGFDLSRIGMTEALMSQTTAPQHRHPTWSGHITEPLGRFIPDSRRNDALVAIKAMHTAIFISVAAAVVLALWDGLRGRPRRRTALAGGLVLAESALYVSNNQVCPLTPLAEELGAERGSVVDMFLPAWAARRIPVVAGSAAALALVLNLRALRARS